MEPISSALAAVTIASNTISWVKQRISDAESISEIGSSVATLFACKDKLQEERNKQASVGDINIRSSIDVILEQKRLNEQLYELEVAINNRWPKPYGERSTWGEIVDHYQAQKKARREEEKRRQQEEKRRQIQLEENIKAALIVAITIAVGGGLLIFLFTSIANAVKVIS